MNKPKPKEIWRCYDFDVVIRFIEEKYNITVDREEINHIFLNEIGFKPPVFELDEENAIKHIVLHLIYKEFSAENQLLAFYWG